MSDEALMIGARRIDLGIPIPRVTGDDLVQYLVEDAVLLRVTIARDHASTRRAARQDALDEARRQLKEGG